MKESVKEEVKQIVSIGIKNVRKEMADLASSSTKAFSISDITELDAQLNVSDSLGNYFKNNFFKDNFSELYSRGNEEITQDNFIQIQAEAALLRKIQIELIQRIQPQNGAASTNLDGDKIMTAFQESDVYKKYFGEGGLNSKLTRFKDSLGSTPTFDEIMNHSVSQEKDQFKLPDLEVKKSGREFSTVASELKSSMEKLEDMSKKNLNFNSLEPNKQNLDKMKLIALKSDPTLLGMMNCTEEGKKIGVEMREKSKGSQIGKVAATVALLVGTAVIAGVMIGWASPAIATALGGTVGAKIIGAITASLTTAVVGKVNQKIGSKYIDKIGNKEENNQAMTERLGKITGIKINDKMSKDLVKDFDKVTKKTLVFSVEKSS